MELAIPGVNQPGRGGCKIHSGLPTGKGYWIRRPACTGCECHRYRGGMGVAQLLSAQALITHDPVHTDAVLG